MSLTAPAGEIARRLEAGAGEIRIDVIGEPIPQGSKTRTRFSVREDNPRTAPWRATIAARGAEAMAGREALAGAIHLDAVFTFPRPKAHYRTGRHAGELRPSAPLVHSSRPDLDKLLRAVGDALTGIVWRDDSQVASIVASKVYGPPGATLLVREVSARERL